MFQSNISSIENGQVTKYTLKWNETPLTYSDVLALWESQQLFRRFFTDLLRDSSFSAYRWETPAVCIQNLDRPFEFVLVNCPEFRSRAPDRTAFDEHFSDDENIGLVTFTNLGGDATLIVPTPQTSDHAYGHLAAFLRNGPETQVDSLWQVVSSTLTKLLGAQPLWLSTAGGGVAWLHVRIDVHPKYYTYRPYQTG